MNYKAMTTAELKRECIERCKNKNMPSSWIQMAKNSERIDFLKYGIFPNEDKPKEKEKDETPKEQPTQSVKSGSMEDLIVNAVASKLEGKFQDSISTEIKSLEAMLEKAKQSIKPVSIQVREKPETEIKIEGVSHPAFEDVFEALWYSKRVCLVGPAGTGKSTLVKQAWNKIAKMITMKEESSFQYIGCSSGVSEAQLLGKMDAYGKYHTGLAVSKFENGGCNLWDEADAMDGNVALIRNAMLDGQGFIAVPNRTENPIARKHEDYYDASCMNTFGDGQDFSYSGRNQQDSATLDRLGDVTIFIDYDKGLENALIGDIDKKWADMLWTLRKRMQDEHIDERILSTRRFADAQRWAKVGKDRQWFLKRITTSWTKEELDKVEFKGILREFK